MPVNAVVKDIQDAMEMERNFFRGRRSAKGFHADDSDTCLSCMVKDEYDLDE